MYGIHRHRYNCHVPNKVNGRTHYGCEHARRRRFVACIDRIGRKAKGICHGAMPEVGKGRTSADTSHEGLSRPNKPQQPQQGKEDSMPPRGGSDDACAESRGGNNKLRKGRHGRHKEPEPSFNIIFHNVNSFTDVVKKYYGGYGITGPI